MGNHVFVELVLFSSSGIRKIYYQVQSEKITVSLISKKSNAKLMKGSGM